MGADAQAQLDQAKRNNPPVTHPVIRTHPVSGRKGLFVNEGFTTHINKLTAPESKALLALLFAHAAKPEFLVRWKWRLGDVAFWDNRRDTTLRDRRLQTAASGDESRDGYRRPPSPLADIRRLSLRSAVVPGAWNTTPRTAQRPPPESMSRAQVRTPVN